MKITADINMNGNHIINAAIETVERTPATGIKGQLVYVEGEGIKICDGEEWHNVDANVEIEENIIENHETNDKAVGAKAVYDFVNDFIDNLPPGEDGTSFKVATNEEVEQMLDEVYNS